MINKKRTMTLLGCLMALLLIATMFGMLNTTAGGTRAADIMIDSITINGEQAAAPGEEYANASITVNVTLLNGDTTLLAGTSVDCIVYENGTTTVEHAFTQYVFAGRILPGGATKIEFASWDPSVEGLYDMTISVAATSFEIVPVTASETVTLEVKNVTELGAYIAPKIFEEPYDEDSKAYLLSTDLTPRVMLQNKGNTPLPLQSVLYTVYDNTAAQNVSGQVDIETHNLVPGWQDLVTITGGLPTGDYNIHIWFANYSSLDFNLTFATDTATESTGVSGLNYYSGQIVPVGDVDVTATVKNSGNSDWAALDPKISLYVMDDSSMICVYYQDIDNIKGVTGTIGTAGEFEDFTFDTFQLAAGTYCINVSLKDTALNTTIYHYLNRSINVQDEDAALATWFNLPYAGGVYDIEDPAVDINITLIGPNYDMSDVKVEGEITDMSDATVFPLPQRTYQFTADHNSRYVKWDYAPTEDGAYKVKAWINGTTTVQEVAFTVGVKPNGTVVGQVEGAPQDLEVSILKGVESLSTVKTNATGAFDFGVNGFEEGIYIVDVEGGYYHTDTVNNSVSVKAGMQTDVGDLSVLPFNTGMVNVSCNITGATITINQMLFKATTNVGGNISAYFDKVVVGTVNVSAEKLHYDPVYNENVLVNTGEVTNITLNLSATPLPVSVSPADGSIDVLTTEELKVIFQEEMNVTTVDDHVQLMQGTTDISTGVTSEDNKTFVIEHSGLDHMITYSIKVGTNVQNLTGVMPLWQDHISSFTTVKRPDATVTGTVTDVDMNPLEGVIISYADDTAETLADGTYTLNIQMSEDFLGDQDIWANGRSAGYSKLNVTGVDLTSDQTTIGVNFTLSKLPPDVTMTPADGANGIALDTNIELKFNYPLNTTGMFVADELNVSYFFSFFTMQSAAAVLTPGAFELSYDNRTIKFSPLQDLAEGTVYTVSLTPELYYADDSLGQPLYWDHSISFTTALPQTDPVGVTFVSPAGSNAAIDADIVIEFSMDLDKNTTQNAVYVSPEVAGSVKTWTDNLTLRITHSGFAYSTAYTVTITEVQDVIEGYYLPASSHTFTTVDEPPNFTVRVGPIVDDEGDEVKGAEVTVYLPNGTEYTAVTGKDGYAEFPGQPYEQFPNGTSFKATHEDFPDAVEWDQGEDIPELKTGTLPPYVFIVIGVVLLVVLIVVIVIILYGGKKEGEEEEAEGEEDLMECPGCGEMVPSDSTSCPECDESFEEGGHSCPECGARMEEDGTTCDECGAEFEDSEE